MNPMDRFDQSLLLDMIGDKEVAGGICRMLSITWVIECLKPGAGNPAATLHAMKSYGPPYFKQIAQSQKAYAAQFNAALDGWVGSVQQCLKYGSGQTRDLIVTSVPEQSATAAPALATRMDWASGRSTTAPRACIISFSCGLGSHCIAGIEQGHGTPASTWYVFDPNYGVMTVIAANGQTLPNLVGDIWAAYGITGSRTAPVA